MGMISKMMTGLKHYDGGSSPGPWGLVWTTGLGAGTSYGIGRMYHRYQNKWYGKHLTKILAGVGKIGSLVASVLVGGGYHWAVAGLNTIGQSGVDAHFLEMGLRHEREKSGLKGVLVPKAFDASKIPGASDMASIGADSGRGLPWSRVSALQSMV